MVDKKTEPMAKDPGEKGERPTSEKMNEGFEHITPPVAGKQEGHSSYKDSEPAK